MDWEIIGDVLRLTALGGLGVAGILVILIWKKNMATRVTFLRLIVQAISFAAIFYVFSYSTIIPMLYELIFIFGLTIFLGRFYCGWLCPLGLIMDLEILATKSYENTSSTSPKQVERGSTPITIRNLVSVFVAANRTVFVESSADYGFSTDGSTCWQDTSVPTAYCSTP